MEHNNFILDLIASLKKTQSQKQIKDDIKNLGDFKLPLTGTLSKSKTKAQLKQDLASMNGTINLRGKFNNKGVATSVRQATSQAQKQADATPVQMSFSVKKEKLVNDIKLLAQQNSRLFKDADMSIKYNTLLDNAEMARNTVELSTLRTQLGSLRSELKVTGNAGLTMTDALKNGLSKVLQLFGGHGIIMQFTAQLHNAWKEAKKLDSSIVSLSKVCDELADRNSFPAYIDRSISKAKELCADVNDLLYATTEFKKLGNSLENSEILAKYAIRLQNVGDTDIDTAISSIKTAMASFDEIGGYTDNEYENKVEAYIDLINNLSNKFSIDAESLANAVRISAGTLTEANVSIEEAASVISAANRYYDDPDYLANTLKIGALRLRASKTSDEAKELEALGENIDDLAESTSKLRDEMMALTGVDIMVDDKNFKSYYQQLFDISKVYQTLDETTQANVFEKMFGKNRSAAGANILKAMADSVEVYNEALQSAGSSEEEFSRWTESAEAATKRFGTAMTETYNNLLSGETVKGFANTGTALLDLSNKLGLVEKGFKGILIVGAMKGITTLTVAFKNSAIQLSNYGSALDAVKKVSTCAQDTREYIKAMDTLKSSCANLTDAQLKQVLANRNLSDSQLKEILQLKGLKKEQREARLTQLGLTQATNAQTEANGKAAASTFKFSSAVKGLGAKFKSFLAGNKVTVAIMAISAAISLVSSAISKHNQKLEEARQKAEESAEAYKQQQSSLDSQIEKYKELKESLDKGNLSTDEARSVKEQLLEIQNSLIDSFGSEASNIDLVNGKYREQLGLLDELSKERDLNKGSYNVSKSAMANSATKAAEDATKKTKEYIEAYMNFQKQSLEVGRIDYNTYCSTVSNLLKSMYKDGKISAQDYHDYVGQMLETQLDVYKKALSAVTRRYEKELQRINDVIDGIEKQNEALEKQKAEYDGIISAIQDLFDSEIDKIDESIDGIEKQNDALEEQLSDYDKIVATIQDLLDSEIEKINDAIDGIEKQNDALEEQKEDMEAAIDAVVKYYDTLIDADKKTIEGLEEKNDSIQKQIDKYKSLINVTDRVYEEEQNALKEQQDAIQDSIDALNEENDALDLQYRKEQALDNLRRSQSQRNKKILANGEVIYTTDQNAIRDAQSELQKIKTEELTNSLKKEQDAIQDSIDEIQKYRDSLSEISDSYEKLIDEQNTIQLLGAQYKDTILGVEITEWEKLKNRYIAANKEMADNTELINGLDQKIAVCEKEKEQWSSLTQSITDETNQQKAIEQFGADWEKRINTKRFNEYNNFKKKYLNIQSQINDNTSTIDSYNEKVKYYNLLKEQWSSVAKAKEDAVNRELAAQTFGANWESVILENRIGVFDGFKNRYIDIQNQIENNQGLINSYNEKISYYEKLKEQWSSVAKAKEDAVNRELAAQTFGANWESAILENRIGVFDGFKNRYIDIQNQIENNQGLINSYNEKISYYEKLKEQWSSIADAYENAQEDMYAAMVLGTNWEKDVLSGRLDTLNNGVSLKMGW